MENTLTFNIDKTQRKDLANAIGEYFKEKAEYKMPGFRYVIDGKAEVEKDGTVNLDEGVTDTDKAFLIDYLGSCGFQKQGEASETEEPDDPDDEEEPMVASYSLPDDLDDDAFKRLQTIVELKQELFKHAFNSDCITVRREDGKVTFEGFPAIDSEHHKAYADFVIALVRFAKNATRVNPKEKAVTNEKYSFRNFLIRLGLNGPENKETRKILLENLHGSAAFPTEEQAKAHAAKWAAKRKEEKAEESDDSDDSEEEDNDDADAE